MKKWINKHLLIIYILSISSLVGVVIVSLSNINNNTSFTQVKPQPVRIPYVLEKIEAPEGDSINVMMLATNNQVDSLIIKSQQLIERNEWLEHQHNNILNDIRQESNNFINKVNTWLTFWTAISAILCTLFPIVFQHLNHRIEQKKLLDEIKQLRHILGNHKRQLYEQQKELQCQKIKQEGMRMLKIGIESTLLDPGNLTQGSYIHELWLSAYTYIKDQANELFKNKELKEINADYQLSALLLYMYEYMNHLQRIIPKYKRRNFDRCQDSIRNLYYSIINNQYESIEVLEKDFNKSIEFFRQLLCNNSVSSIESQ